MDELSKKARRAYQREWRMKNKEKVRQYQKKYWEKQAAKMLECTGAQSNQEVK